MKKVFISQPMRDLTEKEILKERNRVFKKYCKEYGEAELLESFFGDYDGNAIQSLGKAIECMGSADVIVFAKNWQLSRGCRIEESIANAYGCTIVYIN